MRSKKSRKTPGQATAALGLEPHKSVAAWRGWRIAAPAIIGALASLLLLWNLDYKYLWQDEAATAVLGSRMLRFGRPLAYDGVNLITKDIFDPKETATISRYTASAAAAIDYYIRRGDFKPDLSWKWQPWGSFILCGLSLKVLGKTTLAARLPFALAGIAAVLLLYWMLWAYCRSRLIGFLASLFLVFNAYWILHARQCRYYGLSSFFLLLTVFTYLRWQEGKRLGATLFVVSAWTWFQCDYGTVWPVLVILFADAFLAQRRTIRRPLLAAAVLAASIAPFIYYYELWRRGSEVSDWMDAWQYNLFTTNEFIAPLLVIAASLGIVVWRWKQLPDLERRLLAIACAILMALTFWVPSVTPTPFLRYSIMAAPLGCLLGAWLIARLCGRHWELAFLSAVVWIITPWFSLAAHPILPRMPWYVNGVVVRPELATLSNEVFGHPQDPNRATVEWLRENTMPTDEILINYEDIPLMFYLPNPIRGGIAAFRVEDDSKASPNVAIIRRTLGFYHAAVFDREIQRYQWSRVPVEIPEKAFGNNPDPFALNQPATGSTIVVARRKR
jgi:hypothetical protein